jgi:hypothetical protein
MDQESRITKIIRFITGAIRRITEITGSTMTIITITAIITADCRSRSASSATNQRTITQGRGWARGTAAAVLLRVR